MARSKLQTPVSFSCEDLRNTTVGFKESPGGGGGGGAFKGVLQDGSKISVKHLDIMGQQMRDFLKGIETNGSLYHFNVVRLIGFCVEKRGRLLVYK